jgi:hypothetical protein
MSWAFVFSLALTAGSLGHMIGLRNGIRHERQRVNHGMEIALSLLSSKALYLLNGWNRGDMSEEYLLAGLKEYAAEKKAKHDAQEQAFLERLGRHVEKP